MIEIVNLTKFRIRRQFFTGIAKIVLRGENRLKENLSIAFVPPTEIQKLNQRYRKKDTPTDVLSFEKVSNFPEECLEVIICPAVVKEKNLLTALGIEKALAQTLIHGILHTLGYDHEKSAAEEKRMTEKETRYFSKILKSKQ